MNVDDAVRRFRASIPGPTDALVRTIVESATDGARRSPRERPRVAFRTALVAVSVMTALAALIALAVLLRGAGRPDPRPATPAIPPARVDWGMTATARLTPDPGITVGEMRERLRAALAFRTHDVGGAGVEIIAESGDEVTVRLPGAETPDQARAYLYFPRLVIVDDATGVVATAPDIRGLPELPGEPGQARIYYVQGQEKDGTWSIPQLMGSRDDAEKWRARGGAHAAMLSVPADVSIVGGRDGAPVRLMRRTPVVPSSAIRGIRPEGETAVILIDPRRRLDDDRRVSVFLGVGGPGGSDHYADLVGTGTLTREGELRLPTGRWSILPAAARPDLGGTLSVTSFQPYGSRPVERLTPYAATVTVPGLGSSLPPGTRWMHLMSGRFDGHDHLLVGAEYRGVLIAAAVHDTRAPRFPSGGAQAVGTGNPGPQPSTCPVGVGTPLVVQCGASGGTNPVKNGVVSAVYTGFGRVRPGIARVQVRIGGRDIDAAIQNGWWMVLVDDVFPSPGPDPLGLGDMSIINEATVRAWDADGNPVPVPMTSVDTPFTATGMRG